MPSDVLIGTCRAWRGPAGNGEAWSNSNAISTMLGGPQSASCTGANPVIRSLAAGGSLSSAGAPQNAGSTVLYAGMAGGLDGGGRYGGHIFSTSSAAVATSSSGWSDLAAGTVTNNTNDPRFNPSNFDISSLAADSHDATGKTIYATVMGFAGNGYEASHVYRSVDGGAHWTNISSNLPNAPANSVIVDPNEANTLYVGLDTGIYVTTQVANCAIGNCWSVYGIGLPNAPVVELAAAAQMTTGDGRVGELRAGTYGRGIWQIPLLTASFPAQPALLLSPTALSFMAQAVGTLSSTQTVTVTNTGSAALRVSQVMATGDFTTETTCTGVAVAPGATCLVQVSFQPTATGTRAGTLTVSGNVSGGQTTASLLGVGAPPAAVVLNPVLTTFPFTLIGATSPAQNVTISNTGGTSMGLQSVTATGDFHIVANTCGSSLAASTSCTVALTFLPTVSGTRSGMLTIIDDVGMQTAFLLGSGTAPATDALSPSTLAFTPQQLNTASTLQQVTLSNVGDVALTLIQARIVQGDFSVVNSCGNSLSAHSSCSISLQFQPKSVGAESGTLSVSDQYRSQMVTLSGTGVAPPGVSLSPIMSMSFAPLGVGITSIPQTATVTNNGGLPLVLQSLSVTGDFGIVSMGTCGGNGVILAVGSACTVQVAFVPTAAGPRSGILSVADNAPNAPQAIQLNGTGVDFTLTEDGSTTATVSSGKGAVFPLLLSSAASVPGIASFTCAGLPANAMCKISPGVAVALGSTTTVSVTVATGVTGGAAIVPHPVPGDGPMRGKELLWLATLVPAGAYGLRRSRLSLPRLMAMGLLLGLLLSMGCGAARRIPANDSSGSGTVTVPLTPSGTYTVTVSAASAGLVRSIQLTLVVQ